MSPAGRSVESVTWCGATVAGNQLLIDIFETQEPSWLWKSIRFLRPLWSGIDLCYIILQYPCCFWPNPSMPETPQDVITSSFATNGNVKY